MGSVGADRGILDVECADAPRAQDTFHHRLRRLAVESTIATGSLFLLSNFNYWLYLGVGVRRLLVSLHCVFDDLGHPIQINKVLRVIFRNELFLGRHFLARRFA